MYYQIKGLEAVLVIIVQTVTLMLKVAWGRLPIAEVCKDFCECDNVVLRVDCTDVGLDHIPPIRNNTRMLIFDTNNLSLIEKTDFLKLKNLRYLSLYNNTIDEIEEDSFRNQKKILVLNLGLNQFGEVPTAIEHLKFLKVLQISNNQIRTLSKEPWCNLTRLERLHLDHNGVQNLPFLMTSKLTCLIELSVSHNNINAIPVGQFFNMSNLEYLDLSYNQITTNLQPSFYDSSTRYGSEIPPTTETDLEYAVDDFAEGIIHGSFRGLSRLRVLDLSGNNIQELVTGVLNNMGNLQTLRLDDNTMKQIDENAFRTLFSIRFLSLSVNKLSELPFTLFQDLRNLEVLILDRNHIISLAAVTNVHFFRLRKLSLNHNRIRRIDPPGFRLFYSVEEIHMNHNRITEMPVVQNLTNLTIFDLGNNRIKRISPINAFEGTSVREIYLGNNRLETLDMNTFAYLESLQLLDVSGTNYICDCRLNWLTDFYDAYDWMNTADGYTLDQVTQCKSPLFMRYLTPYDRDYLDLPPMACTHYIGPHKVVVLVASWAGVVAFFLLAFWTYVYFDFKRRFKVRKPRRRYLLINVTNELTGLPYHTTEPKVRFRSCDSDTESLDMLNCNFDEETTV